MSRSVCLPIGQPDLARVPGALPKPADARGLGEKRLQAFLADSFITAAELLAEMGDCRARYPAATRSPTPAKPRSRSSQASARQRPLRWGPNKRLLCSFSRLADSTRHWHPWAQARYADARACGHDHPRALRTVGRAWCRIVWQCWQDRVPYDPARHRALQQHCMVTIPTPSGPRPDLAATQRMLGAAVTNMAAQRAEREALDGKPSVPRSGLDTRRPLQGPARSKQHCRPPRRGRVSWLVLRGCGSVARREGAADWPS